MASTLWLEQALRLQKEGCRFARRKLFLELETNQNQKEPNKKQRLASFPLTGLVLPTVHRPIEFAIDWQVSPPIGILGRQSFVNIDAKAWRIARVHYSV